MAAHGRERVAHRGAPLDLRALQSVRIVARPDLREIVERPAVKPSASARAALKEDIGEGLGEPVCKVVKSQGIAVQELTLPVRRKACGEVLRDIPVLIPLDIGDVVLAKHFAHRFKDIVDDFLPREIEHELTAASAGRNACLCDRPIGVRAEEIAVLVHHLRLKPKAEFQPSLLAAADDSL